MSFRVHCASDPCKKTPEIHIIEMKDLPLEEVEGDIEELKSGVVEINSVTMTDGSYNIASYDNYVIFKEPGEVNLSQSSTVPNKKYEIINQSDGNIIVCTYPGDKFENDNSTRLILKNNIRLRLVTLGDGLWYNIT